MSQIELLLMSESSTEDDGARVAAYIRENGYAPVLDLGEDQSDEQVLHKCEEYGIYPPRTEAGEETRAEQTAEFDEQYKRMLAQGLIRYDVKDRWVQATPEGYEASGEVQRPINELGNFLRVVNHQLVAVEIIRMLEAGIPSEIACETVFLNHPDFDRGVLGEMVDEITTAQEEGLSLSSAQLTFRLMRSAFKGSVANITLLTAAAAVQTASRVGSSVMIGKASHDPRFALPGMALLGVSHLAKTGQEFMKGKVESTFVEGNEDEVTGLRNELLLSLAHSGGQIERLNLASLKMDQADFERFLRVLKDVGMMLPAVMDLVGSSAYLLTRGEHNLGNVGPALAVAGMKVGVDVAASSRQKDLMKAGEQIARRTSTATGEALQSTRAGLVPDVEKYEEVIEDKRKLDAEARAFIAKFTGLKIPNIVLLAGIDLATGLSSGEDLGGLFALANAQDTMVTAIERFSMAYSQLKRYLGPIEQLYAEYEQLPDEKELPSPTDYTVRFNQVELQDADGEVYLHIDDLTFNQGDKVVVGGESGSGKSSLYKLLTGVKKPEFGLVECGIHTLGAIRLSEFQNRIAIKPQEIDTVEGSVLLNVGGNEVNIDEDKCKIAVKAVKEVGLYDSLGVASDDTLSETRIGSTFIDSKAIGISGGQKQLLGLARLLYQIRRNEREYQIYQQKGRAEDPRVKIVILDEPLYGLDPDSVQKVKEVIHHIMTIEGVTVLINDHDAAFTEELTIGQGVKRLNVQNGTATYENTEA